MLVSALVAGKPLVINAATPKRKVDIEVDYVAELVTAIPVQ